MSLFDFVCLMGFLGGGLCSFVDVHCFLFVWIILVFGRVMGWVVDTWVLFWMCDCVFVCGRVRN